MEFLVDPTVGAKGNIEVTATYSERRLVRETDVCLIREELGTGSEGYRTGLHIRVRLSVFTNSSWKTIPRETKIGFFFS